MEQLMKRDRAAFQELVYDHFKNVEEETKKYEELNTQLQRILNDKNEYILELRQELEEAREEASMLNAMQEARRERT
jgi:peptidoglycan hydrolase CwlO-like protein